MEFTGGVVKKFKTPPFSTNVLTLICTESDRSLMFHSLRVVIRMTKARCMQMEMCTQRASLVSSRRLLVQSLARGAPHETRGASRARVASRAATHEAVRANARPFSINRFIQRQNQEQVSNASDARWGRSCNASCCVYIRLRR